MTAAGGNHKEQEFLTFVYAESEDTVQSELAALKILIAPDSIVSVSEASENEIIAFESGMNFAFRTL
jgi:hypothetical protein